VQDKVGAVKLKVHGEAVEIDMSLSVGLGTLVDADERDPEQLMDLAGQALDAAKRGGRGLICR
jgi:GGDEF domain-containing protein